MATDSAMAPNRFTRTISIQLDVSAETEAQLEAALRQVERIMLGPHLGTLTSAVETNTAARLDSASVSHQGSL